MKVLAYIAVRYDYFNICIKHMDTMGIAVFPFDLYATLQRFKGGVAEKEYAMLLDHLMREEQFDAVWSYNLPDEMMVEMCREKGVPLLIQESFGNYPGKMPCIFPLLCSHDYHISGLTPNALPQAHISRLTSKVATLALSMTEYSSGNLIPCTVRNFDGEHVPLGAFWRPSSVMQSHLQFVKNVVAVHQASPVLQHTRLRIRPHPKFPHAYQSSIDYVRSLNDPHIQIDSSPVEQCLGESDIIICSNSGLGADGVKAGCDVITYEARAFFAHPTLTHSPMTLDELTATWEKLVQQEDGEPRAFDMWEDILTTRLAATCHPASKEDVADIARALKAAVEMYVMDAATESAVEVYDDASHPKPFVEEIRYLHQQALSGKPFALSRFAEGEWSILNLPHKEKRDEWTFDPNSPLDRILKYNLYRALVHDGGPGYHVGVICPCHFTPEHHVAMRSLIPGRPTYSTVLQFANYSYYLNQFLPDIYQNMDVIMVCHADADMESLPFEPLHVFRLADVPWKDPSIIMKIRKYLDNRSERTAVFLAGGPFTKVIILELWKSSQRDLLLDIGSTLDPLMFGKMTRLYHNPTHELASAECIWVEEDVCYKMRDS